MAPLKNYFFGHSKIIRYHRLEDDSLLLCCYVYIHNYLSINWFEIYLQGKYECIVENVGGTASVFQYVKVEETSFMASIYATGKDYEVAEGGGWNMKGVFAREGRDIELFILLAPFDF